jgi:type I restriction enzyme S subunit
VHTYLEHNEKYRQLRPLQVQLLKSHQIEKYLILRKSLSEQSRIVAILDKFDTLTHSISEGLPREIELTGKFANPKCTAVAVREGG